MVRFHRRSVSANPLHTGHFSATSALAALKGTFAAGRDLATDARRTTVAQPSRSVRAFESYRTR
jgi:hypothetical protein